jgi:hypothetical protein
MLNVTKIKDQLKEFDEIMDRYYRCEPGEEANAMINQAVDEYNALVKNNKEEIEADRRELQSRLESLRGIEEQISNMEQRLELEKPDQTDGAAVKTYNCLVNEHNTRVQEHRELTRIYKENEKAHNDRVAAANLEIEGYKSRIEESKKKAEEQIKKHNRWIEERGPERFFNELNLFYAALHHESTGKEKGIEDLQKYIDKVRGLRSELGAYAERQQRKLENGVLLTQAMLCESEQCYMIIDIGASVVTIVAEMVEVLGLTEHIGEEVELSLPAGIRVKAPQLLIPSIAVHGMEAQYVKAVVLKESIPGVDGCLGLSFLNRFDYNIEKERDQRLILKPAQVTGDSPEFEVFISHKSSDASFARQVYDVLKQSGYKPFLSEVSIEESGTTDYHKAIDAALESATHLIVVCSSRENMESPWVEAEWRLFDGCKRSGKKLGNIVPVLCGDLTLEDLPMALSRYQALSMEDPRWSEKLIKYLPRI